MSWILLIFLFLSGFQGFTQYYSTGEDPASLRWCQIKTERYRLIFPVEFESKATYFANVLNFVTRYETKTLAARVPRIPIIFHTQTVISNGVTVWAPKRIELYTCPPQQTNAEEWLEQLAIHEYRHAVQISKMNQGFTRVLYYPFGEQITGGILGLFVPSWFLEGDATVTETALTNAGRGRSALFESTLRAQLVEKGAYSFDKATLGSYRTFIPDAYSLGYYLVGQSRKKYGTRLWNTALDRVAKYPFMVVPFNSGIRKETGLWKKALYKETMHDLDSIWSIQLNAEAHTRVKHITGPAPHDHPVYNHPILLNDSTIIADKSCMDDIDRFVLINRNTGHEKRLLTPGNHISGTTSSGGNYLVWDQVEYDKRWPNRNFSSIRLYNFRTGKQRALTTRSRYFAPAISHDGSGVAAVHVDEGNRNSIDILAVPSGNLVRRYNIPNDNQALTPNWSPDATRIIFTMLAGHGETIAILDTATGVIKTMLPYSFNEFTGPAYFYNRYIVFSADHAGSEDLYALDTLTHAIRKITASRFAMFDPDFTSDRKTILCSDYTSDGLMIAEIAVDTTQWIPIEKVANHGYRLYDDLAGQEIVNIQDSVIRMGIWKMQAKGKNSPLDDTSRQIKYPVRHYSKFLHLFNPHSWAPASFDAGNLTFHPGVMVLSQNALSTLLASAGWEYDLAEQTGRFYTNLTYRGWYPELGLRFDIGNRSGQFRYKGSEVMHRFTWQETNFTFTAAIPWNFSNGRYSRYLQPLVGTTMTSVIHNTSTPANFTSGWFGSLDYRITASQYLHSGTRDLMTPFGQVIDLAYRHSPFGDFSIGSILGAEATLYFPGIIRHHGIRVYGGYQQRHDPGDMSYFYSNLVVYPRGYTGVYDDELFSLSFNYKFPFWYPDFSAGSVIYLKRLKMNLFYDWANGKNAGYINEYQSAGAELTADFHLLRFVAPLEMGLRTIYYPATGGYGFEFLYSVSY